MASYNVHAGHGKSGGAGCGAVGILNESDEARKVKNAVIAYLKSGGYTVYDCTYEGNTNANAILKSIVTKCNSHKVDLDISIHLNSGRNDYSGDGSTGGVEVYGYDGGTQTIGNAICSKISAALGVRNRGFKINSGLYVLKNTKAQAILIECCFVDDKDDVNRWNADKCAKAIVEAVTGKSVGGNVSGASVASVNYYPKYTGGSTSIVDALKSLGINSTFSNRKIIAAKNGIKNYCGTAEQNGTLLALLKAGKLKK